MSLPSYPLPVDPEEEDGAPAARSLWPADVLSVVGIFLIAGLLAGLAWLLLADTPDAIRGEGGIGLDEIRLGEVFAAEGWYAALAAGTALVLGFVLALWRRRDPVLVVVLVLFGSVLAAVLMASVGHVLGPADPAEVLADAAVGESAPSQYPWPSWASLIVWPLTAMIGCLAALLTMPDASHRSHKKNENQA